MYTEENEITIRALKEALFDIQEQKKQAGKKLDIFRTPITHVIETDVENYRKHISRQFIIAQASSYSIGDYILFKAYDNKKKFLLSTHIYDIQEEYGLEKNFRLVLFEVPKDIAWYYPVNEIFE